MTQPLSQPVKGQKSGGGSSKKPYTAPDTLRSVATAKLLYAISEGEIDSDQFSSVPEFAATCRGRIIQVPANYDPEKRTYAMSGTGTSNGVWDGTFKLAYTNNPALIWYDLILHKRYGLGNRINSNMVNKWKLYQTFERYATLDCSICCRIHSSTSCSTQATRLAPIDIDEGNWPSFIRR